VHVGAGLLPQRPEVIQKFRDGDLCDVELQPAYGPAVRAHRIILVGVSQYFKALFSGTWSGSGSHDLSALSPACLHACLEFAYTGEAEVADEAALSELVEGASYLQMDELLVSASEAYEARLSAKNALAVWQLAEAIGRLPRLAEASAWVARVNFGEVASDEAWASAPAWIVRSLLEDDGLHASEEEVYRAGVAWVKARDPPLSETEVAELLARVRFALLPPALLREVKAEPLLDTRAGNRMLLEAPGSYMNSKPPRTRSGMMKLYVVGGRGGRDGKSRLCSAEVFGLGGAWEKLPAMATGRASTVAVTVDGKLYAVGGYGSGGPAGGHASVLESVERYNPVAMGWEAMAPMMEARSFHGAAVLDGKLYAVCGEGSGGETLGSVERYDLAANAWEAVAPMTTARSRLGVTVLDGKLYALGGQRDDGDYLRSVERYDPAVDAWEEVAPMASQRSELAVAVLRGKLYAVGGFGGPEDEDLSSVERYDPATNTWEAVAPMSIARDGHGMAVFGGKLYAVGGEDKTGAVLDSVEGYDPTANMWQRMTPLHRPRKGHGVACG